MRHAHVHVHVMYLSSRRKKGGGSEPVTNGAPENAVLERYKRGRFAVRAHTGRGGSACRSERVSTHVKNKFSLFFARLAKRARCVRRSLSGHCQRAPCAPVLRTHPLAGQPLRRPNDLGGQAAHGRRPQAARPGPAQFGARVLHQAVPDGRRHRCLPECPGVRGQHQDQGSGTSLDRRG